MIDTRIKIQPKVISFDLDNALYDNQPVLAFAEKKSSDYLTHAFELQGLTFDLASFIQLRKKLLETNNPRFEDLSYFRLHALQLYCKPLINSEAIAAKAFELFIQARSLVTIPLEIIQMLEKLSKQYLLVSVTNGNCDASLLSIGDLFNKNYSPSKGFRAKPNPAMLEQVIKDYELQPQGLLHVGDSLEKDGLAAKQAGTQFHHFTPFEAKNSPQKSCHLLLTDLTRDLSQ